MTIATYTLLCVNCEYETPGILRFQNAAHCRRCERLHHLSPELWDKLIQHGQTLIPSVSLN